MSLPEIGLGLFVRLVETLVLHKIVLGLPLRLQKIAMFLVFKALDIRTSSQPGAPSPARQRHHFLKLVIYCICTSVAIHVHLAIRTHVSTSSRTIDITVLLLCENPKEILLYCCCERSLMSLSMLSGPIDAASLTSSSFLIPTKLLLLLL